MLRIVSRRLASASSSAVGMNVAPSSEENVSQLWLTWRTSACLVSAQNPGPPSFSSCQKTGADRRSRSNWSWGTPRPQVLADRSMSSRRSSVTVTGGPPWAWQSGHDGPEGRHRQVVGHRVGADAAHHLQAEQQADQRRPGAGPAGLAARPTRPTRCRPTPPRTGPTRWARACGLRAGVGPQLVLEGDPAAVAGHRIGDVAPDRRRAARRARSRWSARRRSPRRRRRPSPRAGRRAAPPCRRSGRRSRRRCGRRRPRSRRSTRRRRLARRTGRRRHRAARGGSARVVLPGSSPR